MPIHLDTDYVSPADVFLEELSKKFPTPSFSQQQEIKKFMQLDQLRDKALEPQERII